MRSQTASRFRGNGNPLALGSDFALTALNELSYRGVSILLI
jgi:hypothetical protein